MNYGVPVSMRALRASSGSKEVTESRDSCESRFFTNGLAAREWHCFLTYLSEPGVIPVEHTVLYWKGL